mmetsp:Transcript_53195/g.124631  ORF Transcript_53195/g.124631 Transcript_53195/m.124631 type:complete len:318 (+) Transcript_53195:646-1599(+)
MARKRRNKAASQGVPQTTDGGQSSVRGAVVMDAQVVQCCRHGVQATSCDLCLPRECDACRKVGTVVEYCRLPPGCSSNRDGILDQWRCRSCNEVRCCTGLRECCRICSVCERSLQLLRPCQICYSDFICRRTLLLCGHDSEVCAACMTRLVETALHQRQISARCPHIGCRRNLNEHEMRLFLSPANTHLLMQLIVELHLARLQHLDHAVTLWASQKTKLCPQCFVIIEKNEGCDHMQCSACGGHFSWQAAPGPNQTYALATAARRNPWSTPELQDQQELLLREVVQTQHWTLQFCLHLLSSLVRIPRSALHSLGLWR